MVSFIKMKDIHKFFPENLNDTYSILFLGSGKTEVMKDIFKTMVPKYARQYYMSTFDSVHLSALVENQKKMDQKKIIVAIDDNTHFDAVMFDQTVKEILYNKGLGITLLLALNYYHEHNFDYVFLGSRAHKSIINAIDSDLTDVLAALDPYTFIVINGRPQFLDHRYFWYRAILYDKNIVRLLNC